MYRVLLLVVGIVNVSEGSSYGKDLLNACKGPIVALKCLARTTTPRPTEDDDEEETIDFEISIRTSEDKADALRNPEKHNRV